MADDPTTTPVPDPTKIDASQSALDRIAKSLENVSDVLSRKFGDAVRGAQTQLNSFAFEAMKSGASLNQLGSSLGYSDILIKNFTESLSRMTDGSDDSTKALSLVTLGAIGAGKAFASMNFDNLNTFSGQLDVMIDSVSGSESGLNKLANVLGISIPASLKGSTDLIAGFIKNVLAGADNAMRAERAYLGLAARTGDLGKLHEMAGDALHNLSERTLRHTEMLNMSAMATNQDRKVMESYYALLGTVPGALEGTTEAQANLTKTTLLALGTGRDYKDIVDDVHMAIREYSASIPDAIKFTEQISTISEKYNVELQDVDSSLRTTANSFRMFGNVSLGAQNILNGYLGTLRQMGLSGAVSTDILTSMTGQIEKMSIAQKSFLSAQSGGRGGLMGAFQIDNMLREAGGLEKVFEMVRSQLTRQMGGSLVTTAQASQSPQAAAQMTRQIMMLQQGPLGQFARSPQEAERIVEMFIKRQQTGAPMKVEDLTRQIDYTKLGTEYAKQSATGISRMVTIMQSDRARAGFGSLGMMEGFTGARTTPGTVPTSMQRGMLRGTQEADALKRNNATEMSVNKISEVTQNAMGELEDLSSDLRDYLGGGEPPPSTSIQTHQSGRTMATPGSQLGIAAAISSSRAAPIQSNIADTSPITTTATANTNTSGGSLTIHNRVDGLCINCGVEMMGSEQSFSVNTAAKTQLRGH